MSGTTATVEDRLLSLPVAAARLSLSVWTLRAWVQTGKISSNKLRGRRLIAESEIQRLMDSTRVLARAEAK